MLRNKVSLKIGCFALWFFLLPVWCISQASANPFELTPRLETTSEERTPSTPANIPATTTDTATLSTPTHTNPFDIKAPVKASANTPKPVVNPSLSKAPRAKAPLLPDGRFKLVMTFIILTLLTVLVTLFRPYISRVYRSVTNENLLNQYFRERETGRYLPYNLLYFLFFINAGYFCYQLSRYYGAYVFSSPLYSFLFITGSILLLFTGKHLLLILLGYIFPIEKELSLYSFSITVFSIFLGLALIPVNLLIAYAPDYLTFVAIYLGFFVIGAFYAFRSLRGLFIANKYLLDNFFHFLLYICTVEIAPILLLVKVVKDLI